MPVLIFVMLASLGALFMVMFLTALYHDGSDKKQRRQTYSNWKMGDAHYLRDPLTGVSDRRGSPVPTRTFTMQVVTPRRSVWYRTAEKPGRVQVGSR